MNRSAPLLALLAIVGTGTTAAAQINPRLLGRREIAAEFRTSEADMNRPGIRGEVQVEHER